MRIEALDHMIRERAQRVGAVVRIEVLEVAEAHEARRNARDDGGGFDLLAPHRLVRADHAQRARGRNAEVMHGFRTEKLTNRRAQHRAPVAHARIRRAPGAFNCNSSR